MDGPLVPSEQICSRTILALATGEHCFCCQFLIICPANHGCVNREPGVAALFGSFSCTVLISIYVSSLLAVNVGQYLYLEASGRSLGDEAVITLPPNGAPVGPECKLVFWYHMQGSSIGTLAISIGSNSSVWSLTGDQGSQWKQAVVPISGSSPFTVRISPVIDYHVFSTLSSSALY